MDKNRMRNDKKIEFDHSGPIEVHRLLGTMPEFPRTCGFWIINGSVNIHANAESYGRCQPRKFEFYSLSHLYDGGGRFQLGNGPEETLEPGCWVLIAPGDLHRYGGADEKPYIEDAIRFCGPIADRMREAGVIRSGCVRAGNVRRLPPIIELAQDPSNDAQINANAALQTLLVDLYNE